MPAAKVAAASLPGDGQKSDFIFESILIFTENRNHPPNINCFTRSTDFKFLSKCSGPFNYGIVSNYEFQALSTTDLVLRKSQSHDNI